jgi:hypothetical protein
VDALMNLELVFVFMALSSASNESISISNLLIWYKTLVLSAKCLMSLNSRVQIYNTREEWSILKCSVTANHT